MTSRKCPFKPITETEKFPYSNIHQQHERVVTKTEFADCNREECMAYSKNECLLCKNR